MKVIIFGASGMVGQAVLRESLADAAVESVLVITRSATGVAHPRLREVIHHDLSDLTPIASELAGHDACFFCLGVSAAGMTEAEYTRITHDLTLAAARLLIAANPAMIFSYVSGAGTDSSEQGRAMWARVKGRTENALLALPWKAFMFRPGFILPRHGERSKTRVYRVGYAIIRPFQGLLERTIPGHINTTEVLGRAMLAVARGRAPDVVGDRRVLDIADINALGGG